MYKTTVDVSLMTELNYSRKDVEISMREFEMLSTTCFGNWNVQTLPDKEISPIAENYSVQTLRSQKDAMNHNLLLTNIQLKLTKTKK